MGFERSNRFTIELILFNFLFLVQLCTEATYINAEGPSPYEGYATKADSAQVAPSSLPVTPSPSPAPHSAPSNNCGGLDCHEASVLSIVISYLKPRTTFFPNSVNCLAPDDRDSPLRCHCDNRSRVCSIWKINMGSSLLTGSIASYIDTFKTLTEIDLSNNQLSGTIPYSLGNLKDLKFLDLSGNLLTGSVPYTLAKLPKLERLNLSINHLAGAIPRNMMGLESLQFLDLEDNQLAGPIPESLGDCRNLSILDLSYNRLAGNIPGSLGRCQNLSVLVLRFNFLNGSIPEQLGWLSSLTYLSLYSNLLSGHIPATFGNLHNLTILELNENNLTGDLPPALGNLTNLQELWLASNNFNGTIPPECRQLKNLTTFSIGGNNLSGPIPQYIGEWSNLTTLILLGNNFEGNLPEGIFNLQKLEKFDVSNPGITFPKQANRASIMKTLTLRNCSINGSIPFYIGRWEFLKYLDLSFNNLNDTIPESLQNLNNLILTRNNLTGNLPSWITGNERHPISDLTYNNFSRPCSDRTCGRLSDVQLLPNRTSISAMATKCDDQKHDSLFINCGGEQVDIENHRYLSDTATSNFYSNSSEHWAYSFSGDYLSSNAITSIGEVKFDVSVPEAKLYTNFRIAPVSLTYYALCLRKGKYNVRLHFAESVFASYGDYSINGKRVFDVYSQGLLKLKDFNIKEKAGQPSKEWEENFKATVEDDGVLEIHLYWAGKGSMSNPPYLNGPLVSAISITRDGSKFPEIEIAASTASGGFVVVVLLYAWKRTRRDRELRTTEIKVGEETFTLKQIIDATGNFCSDTEIGRGRSGIVYKARLKVEHQKLPKPIVAGKKLFFQSKATDEMAAEQPEQIVAMKKEASKTADEVVAEQPEQIVAMKKDASKTADEVVAEQPEQNVEVKNEVSKATDEVVVEQPEVTVAVKKLFLRSKAVEAQPIKTVEQPKFIVVVRKLSSRLKVALTVAVKKLFSLSEAVEVPQPAVEVPQSTVEEIATEVYAKKGLVLKHDNLVQLLASYSKHDLHLLIYEYMERGSLQKALFESDSPLGWQTRFHICRGIANALLYLHERDSPIIHRNIKATNILLDASYNPKISDLGLAKLYEEENPYFLIGAEGDLLYMAPEYATRRAMTVKVDVYSFGIVLLEIVGGRNNAEYKENQETVFLLDTACNLHAKGNLGELVDERSRPYDWDQANKVLNLAIMCVNQSPSLRPTMSQVVSVLEGEKSFKEISESLKRLPHMM